MERTIVDWVIIEKRKGDMAVMPLRSFETFPLQITLKPQLAALNPKTLKPMCLPGG